MHFSGGTWDFFVNIFQDGACEEASRTSPIYLQYSPMNERVGGGYQRAPTDAEL
jgi:hypothetical protein